MNLRSFRPRWRGRRPDQRGSGQLGTTFGIGVILTLLLFASHLLLDLWLSSAVMGVARDAAVAVATAQPSSRETERARALGVARLALGEMADEVRFDFEPDPLGRNVVLRVRAPSITFLPPGAAGGIGSSGLDRRVVVPLEDP